MDHVKPAPPQEGRMEVAEHDTAHNPLPPPASHTVPLDAFEATTSRPHLSPELSTFGPPALPPLPSHLVAPSSMEGNIKKNPKNKSTSSSLAPTSTHKPLEKKQKKEGDSLARGVQAEFHDLPPTTTPLSHVPPLPNPFALEPTLTHDTLQEMQRWVNENVPAPSAEPDNTPFERDIPALTSEEFLRQIQEGHFAGGPLSSFPTLPARNTPTAPSPAPAQTEGLATQAPQTQVGHIVNPLTPSRSNIVFAIPKPRAPKALTKPRVPVFEPEKTQAGDTTTPPFSTHNSVSLPVQSPASTPTLTKTESLVPPAPQIQADNRAIPLASAAPHIFIAPTQPPATPPLLKKTSALSSSSSSSSSSSLSLGKQDIFVAQPNENLSPHFPETIPLFRDIEAGLKTHPPQPAGVGATNAFYLHNTKGERIALCKMQSKEPGKAAGTKQQRSGILPGQAIGNEVMTYALDRDGFDGRYGVPMTFFAYLTHPALGAGKQLSSVQQFLPDMKIVDQDPNAFMKIPREQADRLNIHLLTGNTDAHTGNILFDKNGIVGLIDNGLTFVGCLPLGKHNPMWQCRSPWTNFDFAKAPMSAEENHFLSHMDIPKIMAALDHQAQENEKIHPDLKFSADKYIAQRFRLELGKEVGAGKLNQRQWLELMGSTFNAKTPTPLNPNEKLIGDYTLVQVVNKLADKIDWNKTGKEIENELDWGEVTAWLSMAQAFL